MRLVTGSRFLSDCTFLLNFKLSLAYPKASPFATHAPGRRGDENLREFFPQTCIYSFPVLSPPLHHSLPLSSSPVVISGGIEKDGLAATLRFRSQSVSSAAATAGIAIGCKTHRFITLWAIQSPPPPPPPPPQPTPPEMNESRCIHSAAKWPPAANLQNKVGGRSPIWQLKPLHRPIRQVSVTDFPEETPCMALHGFVQ